MNSPLVLVGLAFAPSIYLAILIYGKDKYDREPKKILLIAFLLGALSVIPAGLIEIFLAKPLDFEELGLWNVALHAFLVVAFTEEFCKFIMLRRHAYRRPDFNEPFDGIIYAVFVSLGFATLENVLYVLQGGISVAILRMFTSVPAHFAFAVIMGYYVGKAKFNPEQSTRYMIQGVLYATLVHGAYDFFLFQKVYPVLAALTIGVLIFSLWIAKKSIAEMQADSIFRFNNRQALADETIAPHEGNNT